MTTPTLLIFLLLLLLQVFHLTTSYTLIHTNHKLNIKHERCIVSSISPSPPRWSSVSVRIHAANDDDGDGGGGDSDSGKGYRFGDITRSAIGMFKTTVNDVTGKSNYEFGDLSRWLDDQAKGRIAKFTGRSSGQYQFGDITQEIVRRFQQGQYSRDDLMLLLKIVATVGINWTPLAKVLPLKVLVELLNLSVEASVIQTASERVISLFTNEIDARMKEMITGDRNYQFGDYSRRLVAKWTGKESYEFGDITKTVLDRIRNEQQQQQQQQQSYGTHISDRASKDGTDEDDASKKLRTSPPEQMLGLTDPDMQMMVRWDEEFRARQLQQEGLSDLIQDDEFRDWDERFLHLDTDFPLSEVKSKR